jgi:hypothetical protein
MAGLLKRRIASVSDPSVFESLAKAVDDVSSLKKPETLVEEVKFAVQHQHSVVLPGLQHANHSTALDHCLRSFKIADLTSNQHSLC